MRRVGVDATPMAALSRAVAGSRGTTLFLNLPGSPKGVREGLGAVLPVVGHAIELLGGATGAHPTGHASWGAPPGWRSRETPAEAGWVEAKATKVHGNPPCRVGNTMRIVPGGEVHGTLGCAEFDEAAVRDAAEILGSDEPQVRTYHHDDGDVEVYLEPHRASPALVLVSATDVARALVRHGRDLGFAPVLVESRAERVTARDRSDVAVASSIDEVPWARTRGWCSPTTTRPRSPMRSPASFDRRRGSSG